LFSDWNPDQSPGTYPASMIFTAGTNADPGLTAEFTNLWTLPYDRTNRSRINGLGQDGISFVNTSDPQPDGGGYLGAVVLALGALGQTNLQLQFTAGTVTPNSRVYALRLQFRAGSTGPFQDIMNDVGQPIEYVSSNLAGHRLVIGPVRLPSALNGLPYVQLRWKYYYLGGATGPRAQLRLDDILVADRLSAGPGRFDDVSYLADGGIRLRFGGSSFRAYTLESSTDLSTWAPLGTLTTGVDGLAVFLDHAPAGGVRFYRLREP
jgi:hypothetical protein